MPKDNQSKTEYGFSMLSGSQLTLDSINKTTCDSLHTFHELTRQCTLPSLKEMRMEVLSAPLLKENLLHFEVAWTKAT